MKKILKAYKKTVSIVNETAIQIYESLGSEKKGFLMESNDKENGRYTFMGVDPQYIIRSEGEALVIIDKNGQRDVRKGNPLDRLKEYFDEFEVTKEAEELEFMGGFVGSFGYDFVRYTEKLPDDNPDEIGIETIQLMLADKFIAIDHMAETMTAVVLEADTPEGKQRAQEELDKLIRQARTNKKESLMQVHHDGEILKKSDTLEEYEKKVEKIKQYIKDGHIFQTVLSQRWTVKTKQTGFEIYRELRKLNPSPYLYYYNFGEFEIIGSSPEMIVKQTDSRVYTCPIAGTRKRGKDKEEDIRLEKELLSDEKEKAEHVMLVDLARNDMGRISQLGTVKVSDFMSIQRYSHVMHIVSLVEGKKNGKLHPLDLVSSFLPAGTLSGAPKIRAMEIIDELESVRRGLYGGATSYLDFGGNMNFCITIRTMVKKGDRVYLQAGAGIVADSIPENEYMECCNKVMALAKTVIEEDKL
jgi:anthranilate synthase component 1